MCDVLKKLVFAEKLNLVAVKVILLVFTPLAFQKDQHDYVGMICVIIL